MVPNIADAADYELGWFRLGFELLPVGLVGVFFGAILAIHLSTISSHLNLGALYFTRDLYQRYIRPDASEQRLVWVGRAATFVLLVGSFFYGLMMEEITRLADLRAVADDGRYLVAEHSAGGVVALQCVGLPGRLDGESGRVLAGGVGPARIRCYPEAARPPPVLAAAGSGRTGVRAGDVVYAPRGDGSPGALLRDDASHWLVGSGAPRGRTARADRREGYGGGTQHAR